AAARRIEPAESFQHVNLYDEMLPPRFTRDRSKEIVLERLVLGARRYAATDVLRVDPPCRRGIRRVEVERPQVRRLELDPHGARCTLVGECRCHDLAYVVVER